MVYSSKKYRYVIVDSQLDAINDLPQLLGKYTNYMFVGVARNMEDAINIILDQLPHLVFFDTELVMVLQKTNLLYNT